MEIIDLLVKMANGEEMPKKIKIYDDVYEYDKTSNDYVSIEDDDCFQDSFNVFQILNDEVEIIEEPKEELEEITISIVEVEKYETHNDDYNFLLEQIAYTQTILSELISNQNKIIDIINKGDK